MSRYAQDSQGNLELIAGNIDYNIIAPKEISPATAPHLEGSQLIYGNALYKVIDDIAINDALTIGTNITAAPDITTQLNGDKSYVGMVIHSTTFDTEAKVKAFYGGTTWIQHSGYVLRGATSGVAANSATKTGGADSVTLTTNQLPSHNHTQNAHNHKYGATYQYVSGAGSEWGYTFLKTKNADTGQGDYATATATATNKATGGGAAVSVVPNYKSVYIWERTV